jgi:hypothetical protein
LDYRDVLNIRQNDFIYNGSLYYDLYDTKEIIDFTTEVKHEVKEEIPKEETETITYTRRKRK